MPATFTHASGSVVFSRNPERPGQATELLQAVADSAAWVAVGHEPVADDTLITLRWPSMTPADHAALLTFHADTVNGSAEPFTYLDPSGLTHAVRFAPGSAISADDVANDSLAVTLTLMRT